jgi:hypothetical protein
MQSFFHCRVDNRRIIVNNRHDLWVALWWKGPGARQEGEPHHDWTAARTMPPSP